MVVAAAGQDGKARKDHVVDLLCDPEIFF